jgi:acyl-CoA reductase-like NAD-dependent aldehyde dehydrogenase
VELWPGTAEGRGAHYVGTSTAFNYRSPFAFADVDKAVMMAREEICGPMLATSYDDEEDAIRIAKRLGLRIYGCTVLSSRMTTTALRARCETAAAGRCRRQRRLIHAVPRQSGLQASHYGRTLRIGARGVSGAEAIQVRA